VTDIQHIPVVCAILKNADTILAAQRSSKQTNAGLWEFPGGKVHKDESLECALHRELFEELSIEVSIIKQLQPVKHIYPWIAIELIPFICILSKGPPIPHEHARVDFFTNDALLKLDWAPADWKIVQWLVEESNPRIS
jgi:8-oxo-dGTP diphosphatase